MARNNVVLLLVLILYLSTHAVYNVQACCENVRCKALQCGANRTVIQAEPSRCVCCNQCSIQLGEACVPGTELDLCHAGLVCYAIDESGERGRCEPAPTSAEEANLSDESADREREVNADADTDTDIDIGIDADAATEAEAEAGTDSETETDVDVDVDAEPESDSCTVEDCEKILRCPPDSGLVFDQPLTVTATATVTHDSSSSLSDNSTMPMRPAKSMTTTFVSSSDPADCCLRRFAPKCICNYHQCPTVVDASVKHCLKNPQVALYDTETCCAQFARCARKSNLPSKASNSKASTNFNVSVTLATACANWLKLDRSPEALIHRQPDDSVVSLCGGGSQLPTCSHGSFELTLQLSHESASKCCAEIKCSTQRTVVCEPARCPQELHFTSALLTNSETCTCVKTINGSHQQTKAQAQAQLEICPQRLCAAQAGKCYQHTHALDETNCPICVSTEVACSTNEAQLTNVGVGIVCDDVRTGRHASGERWFSEACGNCYCTNDGLVRCDIVNCQQTSGGEWVSANITMVLACLSLAISSILLIYIVARKLCRRKCSSQQTLVKSPSKPKPGTTSGEQYGELSWHVLNIPRASMNSYAIMERQRRNISGASRQRSADHLSPDEFVYVALNGNPEAFPGCTAPPTANECSAKSTVV